MRTYNYSEARKHFAEVLDIAKREEVLIKRRGGDVFTLKIKKVSLSSPFDVPCIQTKASTEDILEAIKSSRSHTPDQW